MTLAKMPITIRIWLDLSKAPDHLLHNAADGLFQAQYHGGQAGIRTDVRERFMLQLAAYLGPRFPGLKFNEANTAWNGFYGRTTFGETVTPPDVDLQQFGVLHLDDEQQHRIFTFQVAQAPAPA